MDNYKINKKYDKPIYTVDLEAQCCIKEFYRKLVSLPEKVAVIEEKTAQINSLKIESRLSSLEKEIFSLKKDIDDKKNYNMFFRSNFIQAIIAVAALIGCCSTIKNLFN